MKKPDRSSYSTLDFIQWQEAGTLVISPKFQRRGVWSRAAQSYLIDTLLLELPVPPIYLRVVQAPNNKGIIREIVDGQQRISSILSYTQDKFSLSKNIESPNVGKRFSELSGEERDRILQYSFVCEVFYGIEDRDILKVFSRLNTHSVKLNAQELRNGKFFGAFKQSSFNLSFEHLEFWRSKKIFTEQSIARMQEVELTSELMISLIAGIQDKKKSIDNYYADYEDSYPARIEVEAKFRKTIDVINDTIGDDLAVTEFRRSPIFYSLFTAVAHRMFGVPNVKLNTNTAGHLAREEKDRLQDTVRNLSNILLEAKENDGTAPPAYSSFVTACLRQTDNIRPRQTRLETIYRLSFL